MQLASRLVVLAVDGGKLRLLILGEVPIVVQHQCASRGVLGALYVVLVLREVVNSIDCLRETISSWQSGFEPGALRASKTLLFYSALPVVLGSGSFQDKKEK